MEQYGADLNFSFQPADPVYLQIEKNFRRLIETGQLGPNQRLPSARQLAKVWNVDFKTVRHAFGRLRACGYLDIAPKRGTFVKPQTETGVIGILLGRHLADEAAHFHRAVLSCFFQEIARRSNDRWTWRIYDGLNGFDNPRDPYAMKNARQFLKDVQNHPFKGIVELRLHASLPMDMRTGIRVPVVRLGRSLCKHAREETDVALDMSHFTRSSVEWLAGQGAMRVCYLRTFDTAGEAGDDLAGIEEARGNLPGVRIDIRQLPVGKKEGMCWEQLACVQTLGWIDEVFMKRRGRERMAILIPDDVAARGAAMALLGRRIDPLKSLMMLTMTSEGVRHYYGLPVARYEFSPGRVAEELAKTLWERIVEGKDGVAQSNGNPPVLCGRIEPGSDAAAREWKACFASSFSS
ncbi:MAG: GntR family transcriptional regulator [Verrucomicrobiae bacterium]|nr:GntR family transcriptional regulator [Verrucomicrobiae bacterium]